MTTIYIVEYDYAMRIYRATVKKVTPHTLLIGEVECILGRATHLPKRLYKYKYEHRVHDSFSSAIEYLKVETVKRIEQLERNIARYREQLAILEEQNNDQDKENNTDLREV